MRLTCLLVVSICVGALVDAAIISQSSLARCDLEDQSEPSSGDGQTCSKKMVVSMVLKGGQVRKEEASGKHNFSNVSLTSSITVSPNYCFL